jgi:probable phosphoglycerate mutase
MPSRLIVVRHAETTWNAEHRWAGHADPPLSPRGVEQAAALAARHIGTGIDRIVCSDLVRARQTAEAVRVACNLPPVRLEPRWRERHLGAWEGEVSADIDVAWPGRLDRWRAGEVVAVPNGEPWDDFVARITEAVEATSSEGTTLVVTHHGVFRALEAAYGLPFRKIGNCDGITLARS